MATFNQQGQNINGNQYNIGGDAVFGEVPIAIQKLIVEIEKAAKNGSIPLEIAKNIETNLKDVINETEKPKPDSKTITDKLNSAKALIEGLASAGGLVKIFIDVADMARRLLP